MTPLLWPVWWAASRSSASSTTTRARPALEQGHGGGQADDAAADDGHVRRGGRCHGAECSGAGRGGREGGWGWGRGRHRAHGREWGRAHRRGPRDAAAERIHAGRHPVDRAALSAPGPPGSLPGLAACSVAPAVRSGPPQGVQLRPVLLSKSKPAVSHGQAEPLGPPIPHGSGVSTCSAKFSPR